jgi:hypothetical protein
VRRPTGAHLSSSLRPPGETTSASNLQSLCLAPPRAEPSSCAYGCPRREAYSHVLIARRAARPLRQIETFPSQMDVESQFSRSQQALVRALATSRGAQKSRKLDVTLMDAIEVKALAFTRCRPCELPWLCAAYACGHRSRGYWPPPSTADGSEAWAIVPFFLWPRPVSRIRRKIVQPLSPPPSVRRSPPRCPSRGSSICTCGASRNDTARCVPVA